MTIGYLMVKDTCQLFLCHTFASIFHKYLYVAVCSRGTDGYLTASSSILASIVCDSIDHEESKDFVCLYHISSRQDIEADTLHLEAHTTSLHDIKELCQRKTLYMQA